MNGSRGWKDRGRRLPVALAGAALLWLMTATALAAAPPVKLWLGEASEPAIDGHPLSFALELRDADNAEVSAPRELTITLILGFEGEAGERREVLLSRGESRRELEWTPPAGGLAVVRVEHPELLPYELLLPVLDRKQLKSRDISKALLKRLLERGVPSIELVPEPAPAPQPAPEREPASAPDPAPTTETQSTLSQIASPTAQVSGQVSGQVTGQVLGQVLGGQSGSGRGEGQVIGTLGSGQSNGRLSEIIGNATQAQISTGQTAAASSGASRSEAAAQAEQAAGEAVATVEEAAAAEGEAIAEEAIIVEEATAAEGEAVAEEAIIVEEVAATEGEAIAEEAVIVEEAVEAAVTDAVLTPQVDVDSGPSAVPSQLSLRVSPREGVLADGKDFATVLAFLGGGASGDHDVRLQLHSDAGAIDPAELIIPRGQLSARAKLTAQRSGAVRVELLGTEPPALVPGARVVSVAFQPPITALQLALSPPQISLIEPAEVVVRLLDAQGRTLATERPRQVSITLDEGTGQLLDTQLEIPAGGHEARTSFQPSEPGAVRLSATSPQLMSVGAALAVGWPWLALAVSICAGAAGGTLAWQNRRHQSGDGGDANGGQEPAAWTRILAGTFTGTLLYFALLIGGGELVPAALRLNLATAFVAAAVGGWLGPRVFDLIMKRPGK